MAKDAATEKPKKEKKPKQSKRARKADAAASPSVRNHPRARAMVRRAKGRGGLVGFALTALLSHAAKVPAFALFVHALIGGVAGYLVAWFAAVHVTRGFVQAEFNIHREKIEAELAEAREKALVAAAAADAAANAQVAKGKAARTAAGNGPRPSAALSTVGSSAPASRAA